MKFPTNIPLFAGVLVSVLFLVAINASITWGAVNNTRSTLDLQVPFGTFGNKPLTVVTIDPDAHTLTATGMATYFGQLYAWLILAVSVTAVVVLMVGGVLWMTARGDSGQTEKAKKIISNAIIGLVLTLGAYSFLYLINPALVQLPVLRLGNIAVIDLPIGRIGMSDTVNSPIGPAGRHGASSTYDAMSCPSINELSFDAFITQYYKPAYGDKGDYESFACNIGMQCSCPNGKTGNLCKVGQLECKEFSQSTPYCTSGAAGAVVENATIAADLKKYYVGKLGHKNCYKAGCKVTINNNTYTMVDVGSAIKGRHFDLFAGTNYPNNQYPRGVYKVTLDPTTCF
ncbi:MAG: hypothetical protein Q8P11_01645 [bacterium]|nr:hypothetical protein [bacterium]